VRSNQRPSATQVLSGCSSSSSSRSTSTIAALKLQLDAMHKERDAARTQAQAALKASRSHMLAKSAAEKALVLPLMHNALAAGAVALQADGNDVTVERLQRGLDAMAGEKAALQSNVLDLQAGYEVLDRERAAQLSLYNIQAAAYNQLSVDSAQLQANYDAAEGAAAELQEGYNKLASDAMARESSDKARKADRKKLHVEAAALKSGYDMLVIANQRLAEDAVVQNAAASVQKAAYDQLQVDTAGLKVGYACAHTLRLTANGRRAKWGWE
jgi:hypothetical protein